MVIEYSDFVSFSLLISMSSDPPTIDLDDPTQVSAALRTLVHQVQSLTLREQSMATELQSLRQQLDDKRQFPPTSSDVPPSITTHPPFREAKLSPPDKFSGKQSDVNLFISSVRDYLDLQPSRFGSERIKTGLLGSLLTNDAKRWYVNLVNIHSPLLHNFLQMIEDFERNFGDPYRVEHAQEQLLVLKQGRWPASQYAARFRTLARETAFNDSTLQFHFRRGLNPEVQKTMSTNQIPKSLDDLIRLAVQIDNRLAEYPVTTFVNRPNRLPHHIDTSRRQAPSYVSPSPVSSRFSPHTAGAVPMEIGSMKTQSQSRAPKRLSNAEKERRRREGLCVYCGEKHLLENCPVKPKRPAHIAQVNSVAVGKND